MNEKRKPMDTVSRDIWYLGSFTRRPLSLICVRSVRVFALQLVLGVIDV